MGRNLGEKIRPSLETIAKKVDEKKRAYAESKSVLLNYPQLSTLHHAPCCLHDPVLKKSPQQLSTPD
ncbi:MAG: hypothetical protein M3P08_08510 [Thermoproteota archaeon]|jgi:hypothetical protein|nr:hypothetical protein [Thermoproteota archaeon]